jgi:hypothetical protein
VLAVPSEIPDASALPDAAAAVSAPADAAAPRWDDEFAWARERWAKELTGVEIHSPLAALVAWVPGDAPVDVWVESDQIKCRPGSLAKAKADAEAPLELTVVLDQSKQGGVQRRRVTSAPVGVRLGLGRSSTEEERQADGSWRAVGASATSGVVHHAALSSVTADTARFDGQWLEVKAECPEERLPCADGGTRACSTCQSVVLGVREKVPVAGKRTATVHLSSCKEPCPPPVDNPDLGRAQRLFEAVEPFRVGHEGSSLRGGLYRSLASCRASATSKK